MLDGNVLKSVVTQLAPQQHLEVRSFCALPITPGYSGKQLLRYEVCCSQPDGAERHLGVVLKAASSAEVEIEISLFLQRQGHPMIPRYGVIQRGDAVWLVMTDVGEAQERVSDPSHIETLLADLARMHVQNRGKGEEFAFLPRQSVHMQRAKVEYGLDWFQKVSKNKDFAERYGDVQSKLREAAEHYLTACERYLEEEDWMTLIHGDLHDGHIIDTRARAFIIDWGQAKYGLFHEDLPNAFSLEECQCYLKCIRELGVKLSDEDFLARYWHSRQGIGFQYLHFPLMQFLEGNGSVEEIGGLLSLAVGNPV